MIAITAPNSASAVTLAEAVALALNNNLVIQSAQLSLRESKYQVDINRARFLPSISLSANTTWNESKSKKTDGHSRSGYNSHGYSISFSQTLFNAVDSYSRIDTLLDYSIQKLELINTRQQVAYDTTTTYIEVLKIKAQIHATELEVYSTNARLKQVKRNIELGNVAASELYEVKAQQLQVENNLRGLNKDLLNMEYKLSDLISLPIKVMFDLNQDSQLLAIDEREKGFREQRANKGNIDILLAKKQISKAKSTLGSDLSSFLPTITTSVSYSHNDTNLASTDPNDLGISEQVSYSLNASLSLFNGGADYYRYKKSSTELSRAKVELENKINETRLSVIEAIMNINDNAASLITLNSIIETNKASYIGIKKAYKLGTRTITDLLSSESKLYNSIRDYENSKYSYITEMIRLIQLEGALDLKAIGEISKMMMDENSTSWNKMP